MASDKLHLSKKWNTVFIHLAAWSILFIFPLLFIERFGNINRMHNFSLIKFYIQPICIACIFYINYLWLIDKVLFRKKTIRFILYNLLLIVMANVAIFGAPHGHSREHSASKTHSHSPSSPRVHAMARFHYTGSGRWAECRY